MEAMDEAFATALPGAAMEAAPAITQLLAMVTLAAATHPSVLGVMAVAATHPLFLVVAMAMAMATAQVATSQSAMAVATLMVAVAASPTSPAATAVMDPSVAASVMTPVAIVLGATLLAGGTAAVASVGPAKA